MAEDFKVIFEKWKNKDLSTWIKDYEKKFYNIENMDYDDDKKEILEQVYKGSKNIRKYFYNNYLNGISDNLNTKSKEDNYKYINFFRQIPTKRNKNMEENYKEKEIEEDDNTNENNNYNFSFSSKYNKKDNKYKNKTKKEFEDNIDNDDDNDSDNIKINRNYYNRDYNKDKRTFHKNENEKNKKFEGGFKGRFDVVDNQEYLKRRDENSSIKINKGNTKEKYINNDIDNDNNIYNNDKDDGNNDFVTKNRKIIKTIIKTEIENDNDIPQREIKKIQKYNYIDEENDSCHKRTFIDYSRENNKFSDNNKKMYLKSNIYNNNLKNE